MFEYPRNLDFVSGFYLNTFIYICNLYKDGNPDEDRGLARDIAYGLLLADELPLFVKGGCNMVLALGPETPIKYAQNALEVYSSASRWFPNHVGLIRLKQWAQSILLTACSGSDQEKQDLSRQSLGDLTDEEIRYMPDGVFTTSEWIGSRSNGHRNSAFDVEGAILNVEMFEIELGPQNHEHAAKIHDVSGVGQEDKAKGSKQRESFGLTPSCSPTSSADNTNE